MRAPELVYRLVACPYCRAENQVFVRSLEQHNVLTQCGACTGSFVVRFEIRIKPVTLVVEGEGDRIAEELERRLERERAERDAQRAEEAEEGAIA